MAEGALRGAGNALGPNCGYATVAFVNLIELQVDFLFLINLFIYLFYLFIFGCVGSSLLRVGFL